MKENTNLSAEDKKRFIQIKNYHGQITKLKKTIGNIYTRAGTLIKKPAQKMSTIESKLKDIKASLDTVANTRIDSKAIADLANVSADAQASYDAAEIFEDSVNDSVQKSAICLSAAEIHLTNLPEPVSPHVYCDKAFFGGVFLDEYDVNGKPVCDCPDWAGAKWNADRTYCVFEKVTYTPEQYCSDYYLNSIPTGQVDSLGSPFCDCPKHLQWNDPNNKLLCVVKPQGSQQAQGTQQSAREMCQNQFPGSGPGQRDRNGNYQCFCPDGWGWHNPRNPDYCLQHAGAPDNNRQRDKMHCNLVVQNLQNAINNNDQWMYNNNIQTARLLRCHIPGGVAGWTASVEDTDGGIRDWLGGRSTGPTNRGNVPPGYTGFGRTGGISGTGTGQRESSTTGPGTGRGSTGAGSGCVGMSTSVLGQGDIGGCVQSTMPPPTSPPTNIR